MADLPEFTIVPVTDAHLSVTPGDHPLLPPNRAAIEANWQREIAANPAFFNGQLFFLDQLDWQDDGLLVGAGHFVPYALHLWWRRQPSRLGGYHVFGWPIPISSDNKVIAIRMANHTASPGKVYCAAGSIDPVDVTGEGVIDLDGNMHREVAEEIGLDLAKAVACSGRFALIRNNALNIFRYYHLPQTADEILPRVRQHMASGGDDEVADVMAIASPDPLAHPYADMMLPILAHHFAGGSQPC